MPKKEIIAMLLAGGQGSRLECLTRNIAKPAVAFGGKYRIIDFSLSNCINSDINTVGVLTQYKPFLLNSYIGIGTPWDLDDANGGVHILPPFVDEKGGSWYKGTANAIYRNIDYIDQYDPEFVLIISGDHIYQMDYSLMLAHHKAQKADVTVSVIEVPLEEASRFGIVVADAQGKITKFVEKPAKPESNLVSMGIYIFNWRLLRKTLIEDEGNAQSENDFGKNVLPLLMEQKKKLTAYRFEGYWKDVGTIESYYEANMDLLKKQPEFDIFNAKKNIFTNTGIFPPHYIGKKGVIRNSLISNGCTILGEVINSILGPGVYVGEGTRVEDSILLPSCKIQQECFIRKTIVGEGTVVRPYCSIGIKAGEQPKQAGITVIENDSEILEDTQLEEGRNLYRSTVA
ncbi:MAG: glucose-1-phosphate adenylyltransferase [Peptococcaceae bacterium]|jgi:glucose-1-phosphate adenylyltransferase|nr:glucose-1-phosphate adenylyltransferase [Peptococcaceae bacterium]